MDVTSTRKLWRGRGNLLLGLNQLFFSANIVCAAAYALSLYVDRSVSSWQPLNDSGYYFLRAAVRVNDVLHLLHLRADTRMAGNIADRGQFIFWDHTATATAFVATVCSMVAVILVLIEGLTLISGFRRVFRPLAGFLALFAAPAGYMLVWKVTWKWPTGFVPGQTSIEHGFFWFPFYVLAGELGAFFVLFLINRKRAISRWATGFLVLLHSAFWGAFLFSCLPIYLRESNAPYFIHVGLWLIPSLGAAWSLYVLPGPASAAALFGKGRIGPWSLIAAVLGAAALVILWRAGDSHACAQSKDINSAMVVLSRSSCFGSCPVYTITIHGDGAIEYVGSRFVKVGGKQIAAANSEAFATILQRLDQVHFFSLEDRAFARSFDSPGVSVAVRINGTSKSVASDAGCVGAESGAQAEFVQATNDIDKIVGSERWVRCEGRCRGDH
jgi:Domain of unknown function (DUF6438)